MSSMAKFFKAFRKGMHDFSLNISIIINSLLLIIVYFFGVGITSIFARAFGKTFIDEKIDKNAESYWRDLKLKKKPIETYYKQF